MTSPWFPAPEDSPAMPPTPDGEFLRDVVAGLSKTPKSLPCKYFYDEAGSRLFDRICRLAEYYPRAASRPSSSATPGPSWTSSRPAASSSSTAAAPASRRAFCSTGAASPPTSRWTSAANTSRRPRGAGPRLPRHRGLAARRRLHPAADAAALAPRRAAARRLLLRLDDQQLRPGRGDPIVAPDRGGRRPRRRPHHRRGPEEGPRHPRAGLRRLARA